MLYSYRENILQTIWKGNKNLIKNKNSFFNELITDDDITYILKKINIADNPKGFYDVLVKIYPEKADKMLFDSQVKSIQDIPEWQKITQETGQANSQFYEQIVKLKDFASNLNRYNFFDSIEYKYVLKDLTPKISAWHNNERCGK